MPTADPRAPAPVAPAARVPTMSRVRARSSRRILDAARWLVEADGLERLSMRRLADAADVSVRTIYNLFGDKNGLVTALVQESFDAVEAVAAETAAADPIERIWETVAASAAANCRYVPKAVAAAVVADTALHRELSRRWRGRAVTIDAIAAATRAGLLRDDLPPPRLVEQAGTVFFHLLRRWAADEIDERALTAGVLHAFDVCLLAVAEPAARPRLLEHVAGLEPSLPRAIDQ